MTLRLILARHAKSSWGAPGISDHDRALNKRGQRAARAIGGWLAQHSYVPAEIVSSTARRTLETCERLAPSLPQTTLMRREPLLYQASADTMLSVLHQCAASPVMMLAHNPGIANFATRLLNRQPDHPRFRSYPSGAVLVADFPVSDWSELRLATGTVVDFMVPADLESQTK